MEGVPRGTPGVLLIGMMQRISGTSPVLKERLKLFRELGKCRFSIFFSFCCLMYMYLLIVLRQIKRRIVPSVIFWRISPYLSEKSASIGLSYPLHPLAKATSIHPLAHQVKSSPVHIYNPSPCMQSHMFICVRGHAEQEP
jgi:hypothetical protein